MGLCGKNCEAGLAISYYAERDTVCSLDVDRDLYIGVASGSVACRHLLCPLSFYEAEPGEMSDGHAITETAPLRYAHGAIDEAVRLCEDALKQYAEAYGVEPAR